MSLILASSSHEVVPVNIRAISLSVSPGRIEYVYAVVFSEAEAYGKNAQKTNKILHDIVLMSRLLQNPMITSPTCSYPAANGAPDQRARFLARLRPGAR